MSRAAISLLPSGLQTPTSGPGTLSVLSTYYLGEYFLDTRASQPGGEIRNLWLLATEAWHGGIYSCNLRGAEEGELRVCGQFECVTLSQNKNKRTQVIKNVIGVLRKRAECSRSKYDRCCDGQWPEWWEGPSHWKSRETGKSCPSDPGQLVAMPRRKSAWLFI